MPKRRPKPLDPSTLYSTEPISDEGQVLLGDAELMIRRQELRRRILPEEHVQYWPWNAFIESLGCVKACIDMGTVPFFQSVLTPLEDEGRWLRMVSDYQRAHGGSPIGYSDILNAIDALIAGGISTRELLLRLQGDAAKPRARYAESWTVEASGLFDVKRVRA